MNMISSRRASRCASTAAALCLLVSNVMVLQSASAHHSRANYKMGDFVDFKGVVTEFAWANPHAYVVIKVDDAEGTPVEWQLEMNSLPILTEMNWSKDSIAVGETIRVHANPDRNAGKKQIFVRYIEKLDGTKLWSFGRPASEKPRAVSSGPSTPPPGSTDFTGIWERARIPDDHPSKTNRHGPSWLPANAVGQAAMVDFDPNSDPSYDCEPRTLPVTVIPVYPVRISRPGDDLVIMEYEFNGGFREIHMNESSHPDDIDATHMGYSIGRWEDGDLVVHTKHFSPARWGLGRGLPSSESKEVFERYTLSESGKRITVEWTVVDPEYLAEPYTESGGLILNNGIRFSDFSCDPRAARRHLSIQDSAE